MGVSLARGARTAGHHRPPPARRPRQDPVGRHRHDASSAPGGVFDAAVLHLQRTAGNHAVTTLLTAQRLAPAPDPTAPKTLRSGASGPAVEELQQHLNRHGATPALTVDGAFGPLTKGAVAAFQGTHKDESGTQLTSDGVVGPLTWRSLQRAAPSAAPPGGGQHPRDEVTAILAKGPAMTAAEAARGKVLLFQLEDDEFRAVIKQASQDGSFLALLAKLPLAEIVDVMANLTQEVVIPTTRLKPAPDTIDTDFKRANEIYNPHGFEVERGTHIDLSEKASRALIGADLSLDEFVTDQATKEELKVLEINRNRGRIAGYWVPAMTSSRGEALLKADLKNLGDDRTSVVVNSGNQAQDTFAHEVGHALGLPHEDTDANNLMASGGVRNISGAGIDKLTPAQIAIIKASLFAELGRKGVGK